jgi:hypothetical protein
MLSSEQVKRFSDEGFLALPEALSSRAIAEVRSLLDPLFASFNQLPAAHTRDLTGQGRAGSPRSAEIDRPLRLERRLQATEAYVRCRELARRLGGRSARYSYDHAIYKAPFNEGETPWHQDHAYTGHRRLLRTVHFWIPLQPATIENGCMQFVPRSHVNGLLLHARGQDGHVRRTTVADGTPRVACPLPVGGVTVHSPLTLHYTGPNQTADVRRAWILHFGPWGRLAKLHPCILFEKIVSGLARQPA